jgi:hypothetical protein
VTLACSVTGLTNSTTYYVGVVATNAAGSSVSSSPLVAVTPIARPGAPTITAITPGDSYLSVAFTAGSAGGDPITSYQYSLNGGTTWTSVTGMTSPLVIDGLTDGTSYAVILRAVSAAGNGATSASMSGTPYTYPDPPAASSITANGENLSAVITWAAPAFNGGAPISNQTVDGVANSAYTVTAFDAPVAGDQLHHIGRADLHPHRTDQRGDLLHLHPGGECRRPQPALHTPGRGYPFRRSGDGLRRHRGGR